MFLERPGYRYRRALDGVRLLPGLGLFLFLLPLIWAVSPEARAPGTASVGLYLFAVWAALILCALLFSLYHGRRDETVGDEAIGPETGEARAGEARAGEARAGGPGNAGSGPAGSGPAA